MWEVRCIPPGKSCGCMEIALLSLRQAHRQVIDPVQTEWEDDHCTAVHHIESTRERC